MAIALAVYVGTDTEVDSPSNHIEAVLRSVVEKSLPPGEIAEVLGVPETIPVRYEIVGKDISIESDGNVYVDFRVRTDNDMADMLESNLAAEIGDLVLKRLDGLAVVGLSATPENSLESPTASIRLKVVDALPLPTSSVALAQKAGFAHDRVLGWQKGCNSWPW